MNKTILSISAILSIFAAVLTSFTATAQDSNIAGLVSNENGEAAAGETVYVFNPSTPSMTGDTVATAVTGDLGWYEVYADVAALSNVFAISSSACPDLIGYYTNDFGDSLLVNINCGDTLGGTTEFLYIGGSPVDESVYSWQFISSPFGAVESYDWTIDGQTFTSEDVTYTFPEEGNYLIELYTEMVSGSLQYATMNVNISESPTCNAYFFPVVDSLASESGVVFVNSSTGEDLNYFWNFGDGNSSTEAYPIHVYDEVMDYEVCLTVSSTLCSDTMCITLTEDLLNPLTGSGLIAQNGKEELYDGAKSDGFTFEVVPFPTGTLSNEEALSTLESRIFPNPSSGQVSMTLASDEQMVGTIRIHDITGKVVYQRSALLSSGENNFALNLDHLTEGMYVLVFSGESTTAIQKLNIVR